MKTLPARPPMAPLVMLGLLTAATLLGPFAIFLTIRGGRSPDWPPDRPIEWWVLGLVCAAVVVLMAGCLTAGLWSRSTTPTRGSLPEEARDF
ncbi:MAG: hypothetical protein NVSMB9_36390 [Isosphaeraceae bacterium]